MVFRNAETWSDHVQAFLGCHLDPLPSCLTLGTSPSFHALDILVNSAYPIHTSTPYAQIAVTVPDMQYNTVSLYLHEQQQEIVGLGYTLT